MYRALVSFSGIISMSMGEVREISDLSLVKDLLRAGYIMPLEEPKKEEVKPRRKKGTKKNV